MEFGIFSNGYIPGPAAHDTECEHTELMREAECGILADKHNWKYMWFGEHHGLSEYSHMSAPAPLMGYVAAQTDYIHIGSAITSLPTKKEHPARIAERAAMLDHVTDRRFEFGTGRGAGSHELRMFNVLDPNETKAMWDEVIREIPRMWEQKDYDFHGEYFTVPTPHNILPKPYGPGHPPLWVACGNPPTFAKAGSLGIGAIAFNFEPIYNLKGRVAAYKEAIVDPVEQIGQFRNDNVMMTNAVICLNNEKQQGRSPKPRVGATWSPWSTSTTTPCPSPRTPLPGPTRPTTLVGQTRCWTWPSRAATCSAGPPRRCASRWPAIRRWGATRWSSACPSRAWPMSRSSR